MALIFLKEEKNCTKAREAGHKRQQIASLESKNERPLMAPATACPVSTVSYDGCTLHCATQILKTFGGCQA